MVTEFLGVAFARREFDSMSKNTFAMSMADISLDVLALDAPGLSPFSSLGSQRT